MTDFYSSHRSSKNKQGTVEVGYFERWRRSISVKETSEYSVGLLAASLGGCLAAEKEAISYHLLTPDLALTPSSTTVHNPFCLSVFKKREEKQQQQQRSCLLFRMKYYKYQKFRQIRRVSNLNQCLGGKWCFISLEGLWKPLGTCFN